jgi:serine protease AprX
MAPGASLLNLKVLGADGSGDSADVIEAIDWAIAHRSAYNIRILNLSLGHPVFESYLDDPLCQAAQRAADAGILVVAAAGNFGKTDDGRPVVGGIIVPGNTPSVLTVGAVNTRATARRSDDVMATYSSRGPTAVDGLLKPELVAPGNKIVAASAVGGYLARTYPERVVAGQGNGSYIELSGTSMSAAVVSGAAALLLEARPGLTPAQVKVALQLTSARVAGAGLIEAGAGALNVAAAVALVAESRTVLPTSYIDGEAVFCAGWAFGSSGVNTSDPVHSDILVWGNSKILVWGNAAPQPIVTWGDGVNSDILVWGNGAVSADILVWGNAVSADILVWGNLLVWGNTVEPNILVWGNRSDGTILVWGNGTREGDILVWGNSAREGDILVWGNSAREGDILVWGNGLTVSDNF